MANTLLLAGSGHMTTRLRPRVDSPQNQWRKSTPTPPRTPSFNLRWTALLPSYSVKVKCAAKPPLTPVPTPKSKGPNPNWAALDGRMGGRSSSSSSRSYSPSSDSPSFSYSSISSLDEAAQYWVTILLVSFVTICFFGWAACFIGIIIDVLGAKKYITRVFKLMGVPILVVLALMGAYRWYNKYCEHQTSVFKLQVGLLGMAKSLQSELDRIAETADTSNDEGLKYILTETTLALLRHPDYFISAYSSENVKSNGKEVEKLFNELSIEERGKLDKETLVSVNDKRIKQPISRATDGFNNEYIVVSVCCTFSTLVCMVIYSWCMSKAKNGSIVS